MTNYNNRKSPIPYFLRRAIVCLLSLFTVLSFSLSVYGSVESEEDIDRRVGILYHPWRIYLPQFKTLQYLRSQATSLTGLPNFMQQPEKSTPLFLNSFTNAPAALSPGTGSSSGSTKDTKPDWQPLDLEFEMPIYELVPIGSDRDRN